MRKLKDFFIKRKIEIGLLISFFALVFGYNGLMLSHTKETFGVYIGKTGGVGDGKSDFKVVLDSNSFVVSLLIPRDLKLKKKDTIWLRYSLWDTKIGEFIDSDYQSYMDETRTVKDLKR